jgi:hypothetical protein
VKKRPVCVQKNKPLYQLHSEQKIHIADSVYDEQQIHAPGSIYDEQ